MPSDKGMRQIQTDGEVGEDDVSLLQLTGVLGCRYYDGWSVFY